MENKFKYKKLVKELLFKQIISKKNKLHISGSIHKGNKHGLLIVYAPWCPHCVSMVKPLELLGKTLKKEFKLYALNYEQPGNKPLLKIKGYPTMFWISPNGQIKNEYTYGRDINTMYKMICNKTHKKVCKEKFNI